MKIVNIIKKKCKMFKLSMKQKEKVKENLKNAISEQLTDLLNEKEALVQTQQEKMKAMNLIVDLIVEQNIALQRVYNNLCDAVNTYLLLPESDKRLVLMIKEFVV